MKSMIVVSLALVAIAVALPVEEPIAILKSDFNQTPGGSYNFAYESADGNKRDETGEAKEVLDADNKPQTVVVVRGSYSYINSDGTPESVNYHADEFGYHAEGSSIPKSASR